MGKSLGERVADNSDPLRFLLRAARTWRVPPTVVLKLRTVNTTEYTAQDIDYLLALEDYEAGLCPRGHNLAETSKEEHRDAYRPNPPKECHLCAAEDLQAEVQGKAQERGESTAGLLHSFYLDPEVVELNRQPVPPLPPELGGS